MFFLFFLLWSLGLYKFNPKTNYLLSETTIGKTVVPTPWNFPDFQNSNPLAFCYPQQRDETCLFNSVYLIWFLLRSNFFYFNIFISNSGSRGSTEVDSRDALLMEKEAEVNTLFSVTFMILRLNKKMNNLLLTLLQKIPQTSGAAWVLEKKVPVPFFKLYKYSLVTNQFIYFVFF